MKMKMKMKLLFNKKTIQHLLIANAFFSSVLLSHISYGHENDDPVITHVIIDQLEIRDADQQNPMVIEAQAWIGKDLNKFWLKTDVDRRDGKTEHAELQALYSHAIAPYWDLQTGIREDIRPEPNRTWGVVGIKGLAPYFFDVDTALFMGEAGRTAARVSAEYDLLFTQRLILSPNVSVNVYGQNDPEIGTGSGVSDINAGLRLRYEIYREFAPYVGINWEKKFGATADFATARKESNHDTEWVVGLRAWF